MKPIYILGAGAVSPQDSTSLTDELFKFPIAYTGDRLTCIEPDYAEFIDVRQLRRMSRILKMGIAAGTLALQEAACGMPTGIITGTGYGCLEDTGTFLQKLIVQHEQALSPTPFIQSTHNTIGSMIALLLQCQGYNQTYTQQSHSFESALLDAMLSLNENPDQQLLTGAADEITEVSHSLQKRFGIFRKDSVSSLELFNVPEHGTLNGEGAFYFLLSGRNTGNAIASIDALRTMLHPDSTKVASAIQNLLEEAFLIPADVDLVLVGKNGDPKTDSAMEHTLQSVMGDVTLGLFKHLCGEFPTASAFAVWLGARIIQTGSVPDVVRRTHNHPKPKTVLIYNRGLGNCHSLILMRAC